MRYLFICTIGPVQDFIKTARRSRDLWYGSWMLSELSKAAAKAIGNENLIFPAPADTSDLEEESYLNVANKIVARVEIESPKVFGETIKSAVKKRLLAMRDAAFEPVRGNLDTLERAQKQVEDLLEFYWVAIPLPNEDVYESVRDRAETLLASRKNTRNFEQMEGANKPKSSLDGKLESVIHKDAYPQSDDPKERELKAKSLYDRYRARAGEQLSGVDLMKRLGKPAKGESVPKFHSTSHFAALPFMRFLEREYSIDTDDFLEKIYKSYQGKGWKLTDTSKDGSLLYESRITDVVPTKDAIKVLKEALNKVFKEYKEKHEIKKRPEPYYALLLADGDNMGKVIDNQTSLEQHRDLSRKLSEFATAVPEIVEAKEHEGTVIYTGGDDILAYLPLHTALKCVKELDTAFQDAMQGFTTKDGLHSTLSAGLVIAHHLTPLADVLEMARDAEKKAKEVKGKNGLAILSSKRSGEDKQITGKLPDLIERLDTLTDFHRQKAISKGTAYELQKLHRTLAGSGLPKEAIQKEAERIIKRKRESGSDEAVEKKVLKKLGDWLADESISIENVALEMMIAISFAKAKEDMAIGKKKKEEANE